MWKTLKPYVLIASAGLNVAFVAIWFVHAAALRDAGPAAPDRQGVWCPLHRELGVTAEQWAEIEPRLVAFQESVGQLMERADAKRLEVIDLLAAPSPDLDAVRARQDDILATKRAIQAKVVEHLLAEKETLGPDQQARLFEMLRRRAGCAGRHPPMSGRGRLDGEPRTLNVEPGASPRGHER